MKVNDAVLALADVKVMMSGLVAECGALAFVHLPGEVYGLVWSHSVRV